MFRLSRIKGKVSYASKAEHDFTSPEDFDRRDYARRSEWQLGEIQGTAKVFLRDRIAWLVERDFGGYGEMRNAGKGDGAPGKGTVFETDYASSRQLVAWVLHWRQNATVLEPPELADEVAERLDAAARAPRGRVRDRALEGRLPPHRCSAPGAAPTAARSPRSAPSASRAW